MEIPDLKPTPCAPDLKPIVVPSKITILKNGGVFPLQMVGNL
jgi:hypothetical protein